MRAEEMVKQANDGYMLFREVQAEFTRRYPYLKIELLPTLTNGLRSVLRVAGGTDGDGSTSGAWIAEELGIADSMTVRALESALKTYFGTDVQVFRKSGKFWIGIRMTGEWTLKQQNDHGRDLEASL